jgi:K+-transporting ATPase ATPase C chain
MLKNIMNEIKKTVIAILALSVLLCGVYPLIVWGVGKLVFPVKAEGSLIQINGNITGSELIGQQFTSPRYFHPRPSAAGPGYDAAASGGSNLGPLSQSLIQQVTTRVNEYRNENFLSQETPVPVDAVTASGSGLDPHISIENALLQAKRIAKTRGMNLQTIYDIIKKYTENRQLGIFGEKRVNVLLLNIELDKKENGIVYLMPSATKNPFEKGFLDFPKLLVVKRLFLFDLIWG